MVTGWHPSPAIGDTLRARSRVKLGIRVVVVVFILRVRGAIFSQLRLIDPPSSVGVHRFMSGVPALCRGLPFEGFAIFNRHLASLLIVLWEEALRFVLRPEFPSLHPDSLLFRDAPVVPHGGTRSRQRGARCEPIADRCDSPRVSQAQRSSSVARATPGTASARRSIPPSVRFDPSRNRPP